MRVIVFKQDMRLNQDDQHVVPCTMFLPYPDDDPEVVERVEAVAIDGKYTIEDWPTQ